MYTLARRHPYSHSRSRRMDSADGGNEDEAQHRCSSDRTDDTTRQAGCWLESRTPPMEKLKGENWPLVGRNSLWRSGQATRGLRYSITALPPPSPHHASLHLQEIECLA